MSIRLICILYDAPNSPKSNFALRTYTINKLQRIFMLSCLSILYFLFIIEGGVGGMRLKKPLSPNCPPCHLHVHMVSLWNLSARWTTEFRRYKRAPHPRIRKKKDGW